MTKLHFVISITFNEKSHDTIYKCHLLILQHSLFFLLFFLHSPLLIINMPCKFIAKLFGRQLGTKAKAVNDVIIYVGKESDFKEFHGNSKNLCSKSNYFKKILSSEDIEKKDGKFIIKKPNITPQVFDVIIK